MLHLPPSFESDIISLTVSSYIPLLESYREAFTLFSSIPPSPRFRNCIQCSRNSEAIHFLKRRDRSTGSCEWLWADKNFVRWRNTLGGSLLWISGSPGSGKSTLCSAIIDRLDADRRVGETIAYHFVDGRLKNSNVVFDVLVKMTISMLIREISEESRSDLKALLSDLNTTREQLSNSQIREFLLRIRHNLNNEESFCLILDGFDEAENPQTTINLLREIMYPADKCGRYHPMKVLVSSRSDFLQVKGFQGVLQVDVDKETSVCNDVAAYFRQEVQKMQLSSIPPETSLPVIGSESCWKANEAAQVKPMAPSSIEAAFLQRFTSAQAPAVYEWNDLSRRISEQIIGRGIGAFLWVHLVIKNLYNTDDIRCSIDKLVQSPDTRDCSGIYQYMISHISEKNRPIVLQILRWVIYAARPLYTWELLDAIDLELNIRLVDSDIEEIGGGLISTTESGKVNLVHLSLRDYLRSQSNENDILGWVAASETSHEMISHTCLRVLRSELLLESMALSTSLHSQSSSVCEPSQKLENYAFHYWKFHYVLAERQSGYLPGMLYAALSKSFRNVSLTFSKHCASKPSQLAAESQEPADSPFISSRIYTGGPLNLILSAAAGSGFAKLVKLLLEMGACPVFRDSAGNTALHYAAACGNVDAIKLLIDYGGDIGTVSHSGDTAFSKAVANCQSEAVNLLLNCGADPFNINYGNSQDQLLHSQARPITQKLSLVVLTSRCCSNCGDIQVHYIVSNSLSANDESPGISSQSLLSQMDKN